MIASVLVSTRRRDCLHQTPIEAQPPQSSGAGPQARGSRNNFVPSCRPIQKVDSWIRRPWSVVRGFGGGAGEGWREAPDGEGRAAITCSQLLGCLPECGDEQRISFVELLAHEMADGMKQGRGRFPQTRGTMVWMLAQGRRHSQGLAADPGSPGGGFGFDLADQAEGSCSLGVGGKILPEGEGREGHRLAGRILETVERLSSVPGGILQVSTRCQISPPLYVKNPLLTG